MNRSTEMCENVVAIVFKMFSSLLIGLFPVFVTSPPLASDPFPDLLPPDGVKSALRCAVPVPRHAVPQYRRQPPSPLAVR